MQQQLKSKEMGYAGGMPMNPKTEKGRGWEVD
jgi:hypothetical protein